MELEAEIACISRTRHARSPERVAPDTRKSHSCLHFAHLTRAISAEGCAGPGQIALSPACRALDTHDLGRGLRRTETNRTLASFCALDTHDLRRGLRRTETNRTLACISRTRHARSPHDLRRGLRGTETNRTLACILRTGHARSPQRVARDRDKSHSRLHFAPRHARSPQRVAADRDKSHSRLHFARPTRRISAQGCVSWRSGGAVPSLKRESEEEREVKITKASLRRRR